MDTLKNFNNTQHAFESNWLNIAESQYIAVNHKIYAHMSETEMKNTDVFECIIKPKIFPKVNAHFTGKVRLTTKRLTLLPFTMA